MNLSEVLFCTNDTFEDVTPSTTPFYACIAMLIILTVCGNLLVIISISHFKQLHTPTNFLILSLATCDLMVGITDMPFQFVSKNLCLNMDYIFCFVSTLCSYHFTFLSIYNVSLISLDRFYALKYPFQYSNKVTVKVMAVVITSLWLFSFVYNTVFVYFNSTCTAKNMSSYDAITEKNEILASIDFLMGFFLPCSVIIILYIRIFAIARKHAKHIRCSKGQDTCKNSKHGQNILKDLEMKAAMKLGILVIVFITCLLPYFIFIQLSVIIPVALVNQVLSITITILQLNSAVNPIIYALIYPWFQRCAKLIFMFKIFSHDSSLINVIMKNK